MKIEFDLPDDLDLAHLSMLRTRKGAELWHAHVQFKDRSVMGYSLGSGQECPTAQAAIDQAERLLRESKARIVEQVAYVPRFNLNLSSITERKS